MMVGMPDTSLIRGQDRLSDGRSASPRAHTASPVVEHPPGYVDGRLYSDATDPRVLLTAFDVAAYTQQARGRIEVDASAVEPLDERTRADLSYLWRLDAAGLSEMRAVLSSWTANEARVTAFLATWAYERYWFARGIRDVLAADGGPLPEPARRPLSSHLKSIYVSRLLPIVSPVWTTAIGETATAGHMARLAVQEASLRAAYRALLPRLSGEARRLLEEVVERREEIIRFFRLEAGARIRRSAAEAAAARVHLGGTWRPLRVVGVADADEVRAMTSIFDTAETRRELLDADAAIRDLLAEAPGAHGRGATAPSLPRALAQMLGAPRDPDAPAGLLRRGAPAPGPEVHERTAPGLLHRLLSMSSRSRRDHLLPTDTDTRKNHARGL